MLPPCITLEEHYFSKVALDEATSPSDEDSQEKNLTGSRQAMGPFKMFSPRLLQRLLEIGPDRIQDMDDGNVARQVVSHAPALLTPAQCRAANDQLAAAIAAHPDRFSGFAVLPMGHPADITAEFDRCVRELGFVGALVDNHAHGKHYDGPEYGAALWQTAQHLDVPVYLHPSPPSQALAEAAYQGCFPDQTATAIGTFAFGWHSDVAVHVLKLFSAGVFDTYPKLKIVIGHFGEMLPFMLERIIQMSPLWYRGKRSFQEVWGENLWITTSGVWGIAPMACILRNTGCERILHSVDYPFVSNSKGLAFLKDLQRSGLVDEEQLAMIAYKNAERLLGVRIHLDGWRGLDNELSSADKPARKRRRL